MTGPGIEPQTSRADLTGPGIEAQTSRADGVRLTTELTGRYSHVPPEEKELDSFTRKASKERFLLLIVWTFYLQLACGPQRFCKTQRFVKPNRFCKTQRFWINKQTQLKNMGLAESA